MKGIKPDEWNISAPIYEKYFEPFTYGFGKVALRTLGLPPNGRLLDIGAGSGTLALEAAKQGLRTLAIDYAPAFVDRIRSKAAEQGIPEDRLKATVMDGSDLTLPGESFDAACSVFALAFFPNRKAAYAEIIRILKPKGRFANVVWASPSENDAQTLMSEAVAAADLSGALPPPPEWAALSQPGVAEQELALAGFQDTNSVSVRQTWEVPSATWLWNNLSKISPISALALQGLTAAQKQRLEAAYKEIALYRFGNSQPLRLAGSGWVVTGHK